MKKWQADKVPQHTLMIKYLRKIIRPAELRRILKQYVAIKGKTLEARAKKTKR